MGIKTGSMDGYPMWEVIAPKELSDALKLDLLAAIKTHDK